jgi:hypothetical protein
LRISIQLLLANCLAQSEALMRGRTTEEARAQLIAGGASESEADRLAPHKTFPGNRPSITLGLRPMLTPFALGRLIALYEHRVFVEAQIFGINAFDQWGVELGKELATALLPVVKGESSGEGHDARPGAWLKTIPDDARLRRLTARSETDFTGPGRICAGPRDGHRGGLCAQPQRIADGFGGQRLDRGLGQHPVTLERRQNACVEGIARAHGVGNRDRLPVNLDGMIAAEANRALWRHG